MSEAMANGIIKTGPIVPESVNTCSINVRVSHREIPQGLTRRQVTATHVARFLSKHAKGSGCWLWTGGRTPKGYGQFNLGRDASGKQHTEYAHRIAYVLNHGDIPAGLVVMHTCDTPACVNPAHLVLGTQGDNVRDAAQKGHYSKPHADVTYKLSRQAVREIRQSHEAGVTLARRHGVTPAYISVIRRGLRRKAA